VKNGLLAINLLIYKAASKPKATTNFFNLGGWWENLLIRES